MLLASRAAGSLSWLYAADRRVGPCSFMACMASPAGFSISFAIVPGHRGRLRHVVTLLHGTRPRSWPRTQPQSAIDFASFDRTSSARAPASCCRPSRRLVQCSVLSVSMPALCQRTFREHCLIPMSSAAHATTTHRAHSSPSILVSVSMHRRAFADRRSFSTFDAALRPTICRSLSPGFRAHFPANVSRFFLLRPPVALPIRHRRDRGTRYQAPTASLSFFTAR